MQQCDKLEVSIILINLPRSSPNEGICGAMTHVLAYNVTDYKVFFADYSIVFFMAHSCIVQRIRKISTGEVVSKRAQFEKTNVVDSATLQNISYIKSVFRKSTQKAYFSSFLPVMTSGFTWRIRSPVKGSASFDSGAIPGNPLSLSNDLAIKLVRILVGRKSYKIYPKEPLRTGFLYKNISHLQPIDRNGRLQTCT